MDDSRKYIARTRCTQLYVELSLAIANIADLKAIRKKISGNRFEFFNKWYISVSKELSACRTARAVRLTEH